jgi:hypothetical protein
MRRYGATYAALAALCLAGVLLYAMRAVSGSVPRWSLFAVACRESIVMPVLFASLASAMMCRQFAPGNVAVGRAASRDPARIWAYHLLRLAAAALLGYVIGLAPVVVRLATKATWGGPDILALLDGCMAVLFLVTLAMTLGVFFTGIWNIVIVPVATMLAVFALLFVNDLMLVNTGHSALLFSPIWNNQTPYLGERISVAAHGLRILFYVLLTMLGMWAGTRKLRGENTTRDLPTGIMACAAIAALALSIQLSPPLVSPEPFAYQCQRTASGSTLCLHPANNPIRGEIEASVDKAVKLVSDKPVTLTEYISDSSRNDGIPFTIPLDTSGNPDTDQLEVGLAMQLALPEDSCSSSGQGTRNALTQIQDEIERRLGAGNEGVTVTDGESQPDATTSGSGFTTMGDSQFKAWLDAHRDTIQACTIGEHDLP